MKCSCSLKVVGFVLVVLTLFPPNLQIAQAGEINDIADLSLETLLDKMVISASKHEQSISDAPANVFILTRELIEDYGCTSIGEALSLVPGIYVTNDYSLSQIGVRGASYFGDWNSRIMVLVDGRPMTEQYAGTNSIDVIGVDIENIDRIEVVKGPASSLYGSNAFFGTINLITVHPDHDALEFGSTWLSATDTREGYGHFCHHFDNGLRIRTSSSYADRKGSNLFFPEFSSLTDASLALDDDGYNQSYLDSSDFTGGIAQKRNTLENFSTDNHIDYKDFYLSFLYTHQNNGIPHGFYGALFNRKENLYREMRYYVDFGYASQVSDRLNLSLRLSYDHFRWEDAVMYNYYSEEDNPPYLPGPLWLDKEHDKFVSFEGKVQINVARSNYAIFGAEVQAHKIRQESGEADESGKTLMNNIIPPGNVEYDGQIYNAYFHDEHKFSDKLSATGGVHFNYYTYTTGKVVPKAALIYHPYSQGVYKLVVSRGFRSPTFYEITFDDGGYYIGNPDLKPELITSYEFIVTHEFAYGFNIQVAGNRSDMTDLIVSTLVDQSDPAYPGGNYVDEVLQFRNIGALQSNSIEISAHRDGVYQLSGFANVTYEKLEEIGEPEGGEEYNSPRWLANFGLAYQVLRDRVTLTSKLNYISSRKLWDESETPGAAIVDMNVTVRRLWRSLDCIVGIKNLFNRDYRVPLSRDYLPSVSIQRPGRSLVLSLRTTAGW